MSIEYKEIETGQLQKWSEIGTVVEGILVRYEPKQTTNGPGHLYEVKTKDGIVPFFAPTILQKKLRNVAIGSIVKITYTKLGKNMAGQDLKDFTVSVAPATEENLAQLGISKDLKGEVDVDSIEM